MKTLFLAITLIPLGLVSMARAQAPSGNSRDYLSSLVGRLLILRHYGVSRNLQIKESELAAKRGGCDEAVAVTSIDFDKSSVRLALRDVGTPHIAAFPRPAGVTACTTGIPEEYKIKITDFSFDQPPDAAETSIGYLLQTPEAFLTAYGVDFRPPPSPGDEPPMDYPKVPPPGFQAFKPVLDVNPSYSEATRKQRIQGVVTIQAVLGTDGRIHDPIISGSLTAELDRRALDALAFWRVDPARKDGRPVAVKVPIQISFRLL